MEGTEQRIILSQQKFQNIVSITGEEFRGVFALDTKIQTSEAVFVAISSAPVPGRCPQTMSISALALASSPQWIY